MSYLTDAEIGHVAETEPNAAELDAMRFMSKMAAELHTLMSDPVLLTIEACKLQATRWNAHAEWLQEAEKAARWGGE